MQGSAIDIDYTNLSSQIQRCQDHCKTVPDLCGLLPANFEIAKSYSEAQSFENIMVMNSDVYNHPDEIINLAKNARNRLYFGFFSEINLQYCIIDKNLYYWKKGNTKIYNIRFPNLITSIIIGKPNKSIYYQKNVDSILIIAAEKSIYLYPIMITSDLFLDTKKSPNHQDLIDQINVLSIENIGFYISALTISSDGLIFAGSDNGSIYSIIYPDKKLSRRIFPSDTIIERVIAYSISKIPKYLQIYYPISRISYEETSKILAAVDTYSNIRFFRVYNEKIAKSLGMIQQFHRKNVISITNIPISDSKIIRFVVIYDTGERIYIGEVFNPIKNKTQMEIIQRRPPPDKFRGTAVEAVFSLGQTVIMTKSAMYIIKSLTNFQKSQDAQEICCIENLPYIGLSISTKAHDYGSMNVDVFRHQNFWQHCMDQPEINVLTTKLMFTVKFKNPVDEFEDLLRYSKGNYTDSIKTYFMTNTLFNVSGSTAVLLASKSDQLLQKMSLFALAQFSKESLDRRDSYDTSLGISAMAFLEHVSMVLYFVWNSPVFEKNETEYKISKYLTENAEKLSLHIITINNMINNYSNVMKAIIDENQSALISDDLHLLLELTNYLKVIAESLTLITIISKQKKSLITEVFSKLDNKYVQRLSIQPFGENSILSIFDGLREFSYKLVICGNPSISKQLLKGCPNFFTYEDEQLIHAINELKFIQENSTSVDKIIETILKYISRSFNLEEVFGELVRVENITGAISIALAAAASCDPNQIALRWYKSGRSKFDNESRNIFDKRYSCYNLCFRLINKSNDALDILLSFADELFHFCLYKYLLDNGNISRLLVKQTPFILPFLQEFSPDLIWKYHLSSGNINSGVIELRNLAIKENIKDDERIFYLNEGLKLANGYGMNDVKMELSRLKELATIQKVFSSRKGFASKVLMDQQNLLKEITKNGYWDLALRLAGIYPVATDNKKQLLSQLWTNFLIEQNYTKPLSKVFVEISDFSKTFENKIEIFDASVVMPVFEEFKMNRGGDPLWASELLLNCGVEPKDLFNNYMNLLKNQNLATNIRANFSYSAIKIADKMKKINSNDYHSLEKWISTTAKDYEFFNDALNSLHNTRQNII